MRPLISAVTSIGLSVTAQFALKSGARRLAQMGTLKEGLRLSTLWSISTEPRLLVGFLLYGLSAIIWLNVLASWEVSKAYPFVGAGFMVTLLVGMLTGESVSIPRAAGAIFISLGVVLVARS